jgi:hypothetical protein
VTEPNRASRIETDGLPTRSCGTPAYDASEYSLNLARAALDEIDAGTVGLSAVIAKAARVARIMRDFDNLLWLELELVCLRDPAGGPAAFAEELKPHYSKDEWTTLGVKAFKTWQSERRMPFDIPALEATEGECSTLSVEQIESKRALLRRLREDLAELSDAAARGQTLAALEMFDQALATFLDRIRARVRTYLSQVETSLVMRTSAPEAFERLRVVAKGWLAGRAPKVLGELEAATERCTQGTAAAYAQALLACRRALMELADVLCPVREVEARPLVDAEHGLTQDKYINRLMDFLAEHLPAKRHRDSINANLADVGRRIEATKNLAHKGVHSEVTPAEAHSCVAQTWLVIADIALIDQGHSAALVPGSSEAHADG